MVDGPDGPVRLRTGGSVGVGMAAGSGYDADVLLRDADAAMYAAKRARKIGGAVLS